MVSFESFGDFHIAVQDVHENFDPGKYDSDW